MAFLEDNLPDIVRAVLPFGDRVIRFNPVTGEELGSGFEYRPAVLKANRSPVPTTLFQNPEYDGISAILYSPWDEINRPDDLGAGFTVIRNPRASNPIPEGFFKFGREFVITEGAVEPRMHSPESQPLIKSLRRAADDRRENQ